MKRLLMIGLVCFLLLCAGCTQGKDTVRQELPESEPDAIEPEVSGVQIVDNEGQDITADVIELWEKANQVYNVDDTEFFGVDMADPVLLFEDAPAYFMLTDYDERADAVFTESGKLQLEQTAIGGPHSLIQKADGNVYRMGPWKTGVYYGDALTGADTVESSADKLVLNMKYSIRTFGYEMLDGDVNFTVKNVDGQWLVEDYIYPEASQQQNISSMPLNDLPEMSVENQVYAGKYLGPAQYTLIRYSFSDEDFGSITADGWGTFAMLAEDFYRVDEQGQVDENLYAEFWRNGAGGFPADFFEGAIQQYLKIPSSDIQEAFGELYSAEQGRYLFEDGRGGPGYITAIVTDVKEDADSIQLGYDAYWVLPDDYSEGVVYQYDFSGMLTVQKEGNAFYYIGNQI